MNSLVVILVLVLVVAFVVMQSLKKAGVVGDPSGNSILIVGPMGAGKTALFYRLIKGEGKEVMTVTSQTANVGDFKTLEGKKTTLIDLPGHDSQWPTVQEHLPSAKGIIFLVDSTDPNIQATGQKMFDMLSDPQVKRRRTPVLVACNKAEITGAHGIVKIEGDIAEELQSHAEMKDSIEDTEGNIIVRTLGKEETDEEFAFDQSPCPVQFAAVSVMKGDIESILKFCNSL